MRPQLFVTSLVFATACATSGPDDVARRYAQALRENRLSDAYALTSEEQRSRETEAAFATRYERESLRLKRADEILAETGTPRVRAGPVEAVKEEDGWRISELFAVETPKEVVTRFLRAIDARDFDTAYRMLSARWRAQYTPALLREDFVAEPAAAQRIARIRAALESPFAVTGDGAVLPLGEGKNLRLQREGETYKLSTLE